MTVDSFIVPAMSWDGIGQIADKIRADFGVAARPDFPIMTLLEKVLDAEGIVELRVGKKSEMGGAEGFTCPHGTYIELREDVYYGAWNGEGRHRFTAAHELGHYVLHSNPDGQPLARAPTNGGVETYRLSEPQANQFAAELLMPRNQISQSDTALLLAQRHEVSIGAAENRLKYLRDKGII